MRPADLIIFDLDGTLVDSRQDIANAVNFTLREVGLSEKSPGQISSYIGMGVEDLIRKSLGNKQNSSLKRALPIFEQYYRKHCTDNSTLYPGVEEILNFFKHKKKAIITNRNREFAVATLKAIGIYDYFEDIIGGDDTNCMKPSSCPLDKFLYGLDINKDRTIIVGDMDIDILAGKRAGIITCGVTYGIGKREDITKAKPDFIIDRIIELEEIIN
jgi:phosphoglycolate phosphatase